MVLVLFLDQSEGLIDLNRYLGIEKRKVSLSNQHGYSDTEESVQRTTKWLFGYRKNSHNNIFQVLKRISRQSEGLFRPWKTLWTTIIAYQVPKKSDSLNNQVAIPVRFYYYKLLIMCSDKIWPWFVLIGNKYLAIMYYLIKVTQNVFFWNDFSDSWVILIARINCIIYIHAYI